jgi:pyridinium-3,5-bisthiocarboxylic acid mononucleotide nickel chelatase
LKRVRNKAIDTDLMLVTLVEKVNQEKSTLTLASAASIQCEVMRIAYFDCFSGAAGDMIVAALLDAGVNFDGLSAAIGGLGLSGCRISAEKVKKQGFSATYFSVSMPEVPQTHRHLKHIIEIINAANISSEVRDRSIQIFTRLAQAEAKVHGTTVEKVHFHEVGAVDAIIDVIGSCLALEMLKIDKVVCSPIPVGSGAVLCEHGIMPVPAPATAELLRGVPIAACEETGELITPTGAAILNTLASEFGPMPAMTVTGVGYGAGTRDGKTRPNVLRVMIGEGENASRGDVEQLMLLETNIDDATAQVVAYCSERLLAEGALDVWAQPIQMKKQRSGVMLSVLCRHFDANAMETILFRETPTLGIRRRMIERKALPRRVESVETRFGAIRIKVGEFEGSVTATPEYEDCRAAALKYGGPLCEVLTAANAAWRARDSFRPGQN